MSDNHALLVTLRAYAAHLEHSATALREDEPPDSEHAHIAEAYSGCARDVLRILAGELKAHHLEA